MINIYILDKNLVNKYQEYRDEYYLNKENIHSRGSGILLQYIRLKYHISDKIILNENGKPYFENKEYYFNISHSDKYIVLALSSKEIGLDIQKIDKVYPKIVKRYFDEKEQDLVNKDEKYFFYLWTLKEAHIKYFGENMSQINKYHFLLEKKTDEYDTYYDIQKFNDYIIAIVTKNQLKINLEELDEDKLSILKKYRKKS